MNELRKDTDKLLEEVRQLDKFNFIFKRLFYRFPFAMALVRVDGNIEKANVYLCRILGKSEDEVTKMHFSEFTHPDDVAKDQELLNKMNRGEIDQYDIKKRYYSWVTNDYFEAHLFVFMVSPGEFVFGVFRELPNISNELKDLFNYE